MAWVVAAHPRNTRCVIYSSFHPLLIRPSALEATVAADRSSDRYLVEGSVRTEKERMRISANLVDIASDQSLWTEHYEKSFLDIFLVQDEVCRSIVRALRAELDAVGDSARSPARHTKEMRTTSCCAGWFWRYSRVLRRGPAPFLSKPFRGAHGRPCS